MDEEYPPEDSQLLFNLVMDTMTTLQNTGLPAGLIELTFISFSEYMKKYTPESFNETYMPYVEQIVEQIHDMANNEIEESEGDDTLE